MSAPTLNVNLHMCDSGCDTVRHGQKHYVHCAASPVLIPCPIPRSVAFTVVPGECDCTDRSQAPHGPPRFLHASTCPARPIRVSCSISGKTWAASHISAWETEDGIGLNTTEEARACRDRWALVKALVLGKGPREWDWARVVTDGTAAKHVAVLFTQRDAVYAALVKRVRAEEAGDAADSELARIVSGFTNHHLPTDTRVSAAWLHAYVEHLIEQVGGLT